MDADHDRMGDIGPERGIGHPDVPDAAAEAFPGGIDRGTVVGIAAEHAVEEDVRAAAEHVQAVAPRRVGDAPDVVDGHIR